MKQKLIFEKFKAVQDMICLIQKNKNFSVNEAIKYALTSNIYETILEKGYGGIALDLWGHDNPSRKWNKLKDQCVEIELEDDEFKRIKAIENKYNLVIEDAVSYFLVFTMDLLGYHI